MFVSGKDVDNNSIDLSGDFAVYDDISFELNTELATLSKLKFKSNVVSAMNTGVSGEVTMPSKYLEKDENGKLKLRTVTTIKENAFKGCAGLTSVKIGKLVSRITGNPFANCNLINLEVDEENTHFTSEDNCIIEEVNSVKTLRVGCGTSIIPKDVVVIGENAFKDCLNLTSVNLPVSVDTVSAGAFENCVNLKTLTIPRRFDIVNGEIVDLGIKIFAKAFAGCISATNLNLGSEITSIDTTMFTDFGKTNGFTLNIGESIKVIKSGSFAGLTNLKELILNRGLEAINSQAFKGCERLEAINLPQTVTSIGESAFEGCSNVTGLTISRSVASIGDKAFAGLTKLQTLNYNSNISTIPEGLFASIGTESKICEVVIGASVTRINTGLFVGCTGITKLTIGGNVQTIGESAFENCTKLSEIKLGKSLEYIERSAFAGCENLKNFIIPDRVEELGERAFYNCNSLTELTISSGIRTLHPNTFENCSNVSLLKINVDNPEFKGTVFNSLNTNNEYGLKVIFNNKGKIANQFFVGNENVSEIEIGTNVQSIGNEAFSGCVKLKFINIGENVTEIGANAFSGCVLLKEVTIPSAVTAVGMQAFSDCTELTTVVISGDLSEDKKDANGRTNGYQMFLNCKKLATAIFNGNAKTVPEMAFEECTALHSVTLTDIETIGQQAFKNCKSIQFLELPQSIEVIREKAFENCTGLLKLNGFEDTSILKVADGLFKGCTNLESAQIPNNAVEIGVGAFNGCERIQSIQLNPSLTIIGESAFAGCKSLRAIDIPDSVESLGNNVFRECTSLTTVSLGAGVTDIKAETFASSPVENLRYNANYETTTNALGSIFNSLKTVTIGENIHTVREGEFQNLTSLETVTIGTSVTEIKQNAFASTSITSVSIPTSVSVIGDGAFKDSKLVSVAIPNSVKDENLGVSAFEGCGSLKSVSFSVGLTKLKANTFKETGLEEVNIPSNIKEIDESTFCGSPVKKLTYNSNLIVTNGKINDAFKNTDTSSILETVIMGEGVTEIKDNEFNGLTNLKNVVIGNKVTIVGASAFANCSALETINLNNVKTIGIKSFDKCSALKDVIFGEKIWDIPAYAFVGTVALTEIDFPSNIKRIDSTAFLSYNNENKPVNDSIVKKITYHSLINEDELQTNEEKLPKFNEIFKQLESVFVGDEVEVIQEEEFDGLLSLKSVKLGSSVQTIRYGAFYNTGITEVFIPKSVEILADYAFGDCESLEVVEFAEDINLPEIGKCAFANTVIKQVTIPNSVITIKEWAFGGCEELSDVVIGTKVQTIEKNAFYNINISSLYVPDSVIQIGSEAFADIETLKNVTLGSGLKKIYVNSFDFDYESKDSMPDKVGKQSVQVEIENNIINLEYNSNIKVISDNDETGEVLRLRHVFPGLTSVVVGENVTIIKDREFSDEFTEYEKKEDPAVSTAEETPVVAERKHTNINQLTIKTGVRTIGDYAFRGIGISELQLTQSIVEIGEKVFENSKLLKKVDINGDKVLGEGVFRGCLRLEEAFLTNIVTVSGYLFEGCEKLHTLAMNNVTEIQYYAFKGCSSLTGLNIVSVKNIGTGAFQDCVGLETASLTVTETIGDSAFYGCEQLLNLSINSAKEIGAQAFYGCTRLASIILPNTLVNLGIEAFAYCSKIERIESRANIENIGENAFIGVGSDTSGINLVVADGVLGIKNNTFISLQNISELTIGRTVEWIESNAFGEAINNVQKFIFNSTNARKTQNNIGIQPDTFAYLGATLQKDIIIQFGENVEFIPDYLLSGCLKLKTMTIPSKIKGIGDGAFQDSTLTIIQYSGTSTLEYIGEYAFAGTNLVKFEIAPEVNQVGEGAFSEIETLVEVDFSKNNKLNILNKSLFEGTINLKSINLNVNTELEDSVFKNSGLEIINSNKITKIGASAFEGTKLHTFIIGEIKDKQIKQNAFKDCVNLVNFTLNESVEEIQNSAFQNCSNLRNFNNFELALSDYEDALDGGYSVGSYWFQSHNIKVIGASAFEGCENIPFIVFDDSLQSVGVSAFKNCIRLARIDKFSENLSVINAETFANTIISSLALNDSITDIDYTAFENVTTLETLSYNSDITISDSKRMGEVFPSLKNVILGNNVTIVKDYEFTALKLDTITLTNVEHIGDYAFFGTNIKILELPETLKTIGVEAFAMCGEISGKLILPNSLESMGKSAFNNAKNLSSVEFGAKLEEIHEYTFANCTGLKLVNLPESLKTINVDSFYGCDNLENLTYSSNFKLVSNEDSSGDNLRFKDVFKNLKTITTYDNVSMIRDNEFKGLSQLETLIMRSETIEIGASAFADCTNLSHITLASSLTKIGLGAFANTGINVARKNVIIPSDMTVDQFANIEFEDLTSNPLYSLSDNTYLCHSVIENEIIDLKLTSETLNRYAFYGYKHLNSLEMANNDIDIPMYAFANTGVKYVMIDADKATIGSRVFENCLIENIELFIDSELKLNQDSLIVNPSNDVLGPKIKTLYYTVNPIIFNMQGEEITDSRWKDVLNPTIESIGYNAQIEELNCNANEIRSEEFIGLDSIKTLNFNRNVETIHATSFSGSLIENLIVDIDTNEHLFNVINDEDISGETLRLKDVLASSKSTLKNIKYGIDYATTIKDNEFAGMNKLETLEIGETVSLIGANAFKNCTKLLQIYLNLETEKERVYEESAFEGINASTLLLIGNNSSSDKTTVTYETSKGLLNFINIKFENRTANPLLANGGRLFTLNDFGEVKWNGDPDDNHVQCVTLENSSCTFIDGDTSSTNFVFSGYNQLRSVSFVNCEGIGDHAFKDCSNLESIDFGNAEEDFIIGNESFKGCLALTEINIPEHCLSVGKESFAGSGLREVSVGKDLESISENAFNGCKSLESVNFVEDSNLTNIGFSAFNDCVALKEIDFTTTNLNSIGKEAFQGCSELKIVKTPNSLEYLGYEFNTETGKEIYTTVFTGCENLEHVVIGSGVKKLNEDLFKGTLFTKSNTGTIFEYASDIEFVKNIDGVSESEYHRLGEILTSVGTVQFNGVSIRDDEFIGNESLHTLRLNWSSENANRNIGNNAFKNCTNLQFVNSYSYESGVYKLLNNTIAGKSESIEIGFTIGDNAFYGCKLSDVNYIKATEIGVSAFAETQINKLDLDVSTVADSSANYYGEYDSDGDGVNDSTEKLVKIYYPGKVGNSAFANLEKLENLSFNVGEMGELVFHNSKNLKGAYMKGGHLGIGAFIVDDYEFRSDDSILFVDSDKYTAIDRNSISYWKKIRFLSSYNSSNAILTPIILFEDYPFAKIANSFRNVEESSTSVYYRIGETQRIEYVAGIYAQYIQSKGGFGDYISFIAPATGNKIYPDKRVLQWQAIEKNYEYQLLKTINMGVDPNYKYWDTSINPEESVYLYGTEVDLFSYSSGYYNKYAMINYNKTGVIYFPTSVLN